MTNFLQHFLTLTRHTEPLVRLPHETRYAFINQSHAPAYCTVIWGVALSAWYFFSMKRSWKNSCLSSYKAEETNKQTLTRLRHVFRHAKHIEPYAKSGSCTKTNVFGTIKSMFFCFFLFFRILRFPKCRHQKQNPCWSVNVVLKWESQRGNC